MPTFNFSFLRDLNILQLSDLHYTLGGIENHFAIISY